MIEMRDYPVAEDFLDAIQRCGAQAREALSDMEWAARKYANGDYYMTEEQVAELLRCDVEQLPYALAKYKPLQKSKPLYRRSDVDDFIASKRIGGKKI